MGEKGRSELGAKLRQDVREWKLAALRLQHPTWTEPQLQAELAKIYLRATT